MINSVKKQETLSHELTQVRIRVQHIYSVQICLLKGMYSCMYHISAAFGKRMPKYTQNILARLLYKSQLYGIQAVFAIKAPNIFRLLKKIGKMHSKFTRNRAHDLRCTVSKRCSLSRRLRSAACGKRRPKAWRESRLLRHLRAKRTPDRLWER